MGGRYECSLGKGMSYWEARGESLKSRIRRTGWILLLAQGQLGAHKEGAEAAAPYGCPFLSTHCAATLALAAPLPWLQPLALCPYATALPPPEAASSLSWPDPSSVIPWV